MVALVLLSTTVVVRSSTLVLDDVFPVRENDD